MRKSTENQDETRTHGQYFSPRSKVKDLALQEHLSPHLTSFNQETPMKPSQVPNLLSLPPPRRVLPLLSPELCHGDRLGSTRQPPHALGPICSTEFNLGSSTNVGTPTLRPHHMPRDRLGPPPHSAQHSGSFCSSPLVPGSQSHFDTTAKRSQPLPPGINHHASPHFMKDLNNHSRSSHIKGHQETEPMVILSYSGNTNLSARSQELHKAQSSNVRSPMPTVQLHRPPVTPSFNTSAQQNFYQPPFLDFERLTPGNSQCPAQGHHLSPSTKSSERTSVSSLPNMHSPVAPYQDQQLKRTPSNGKPIPAVDLNCSSQKRCREFEGSEDNAKKLCLQGPNSGKPQTPKPTVCSAGSTSLVTSSRQPSLELPPETTDSHLCLEPACGQSSGSELPSTLKPAQPSCASLSPKPCVRRPPSAGAKQAYISSSHNDIVKIKGFKSPAKSDEDGSKKISKENDKRIKPSTLSSDVPQRDTSNLPHVQQGSHHSAHSHHSTLVLPAKPSSKANRCEESNKTDSGTSKQTSDPLRCRTAERRKTSRLRRPTVIPDDVDELFTPDPLTYVVSPGQKTAKSKTDGETIKLSPSEKSSSSTVSSSSTPVARPTCHKTQNFKVTGSSNTVDTNVSYSASNPQVTQPTVALHRVNLENIMLRCSQNSELKNSPTISSGRQLKEESVKSGDKHVSCLPNKVTSVADTAASQQTSTSSSHCSQSLSLRRQTSDGSKKQASEEEDPIDVELDLGLSFALDFDVTQSSHSSEEEQLLSLQEMMERVTMPPDTPEKGAFSEPSTPGHRSSQQPLQATTKPGNYKNNLDQMLKEINTNKKAKEIETQLLTACQEDLLRIAEYEEAEENQEEDISTEQQEFLQRYSLMSNAIREVPPGEVVFNLEKFGQIFNQDTLQLRKCMVNPQGTAQKTLLWSSPAQLRLHVNIGLFQEAYNCRSPCPSQVTRFLFKMMSVHSERMVSEKILQALCDIACTAAFQIVKNGSQQFKVWVPSLADVTLVLMNMGVAFVTLFPFENLQPPFTEGDLLEDIYIDSNSPSSNKEQSSFPEHNCNNILKYLSYCMGLCPRAYSDDELLLLLTVVGRVALDSRLILQSSVELYPLQYKIINNIRDWDTMLPRICLALTNLADDHHNMCLVVQLLPDNTRGKQLRRHLSLSMISKLLDGNCTYRPAEKEFQLSMLRPYLPCMQPSTLLRSMLRNQKDKGEDMATLDQQSYYLCYSLLTLANEASNFQFFPAHQKKQLLHLCSELETHVKCDIRESEKCLYRSKVKDLVARIYTKWQMLLQRTRPLNGKLYDYWQPLPVDTLLSSQEEEPVISSDDEEDTVMIENPVTEEDQQEEETNEAEKGPEVTASDKVEEKEEGTGELGEERREETEGDSPMDEKNETEEAAEPLS